MRSAVPPCPKPRVPAEKYSSRNSPPSPVSIFGFAPVPRASYLQTPPESHLLQLRNLVCINASTAKRPPRCAQRVQHSRNLVTKRFAAAVGITTQASRPAAMAAHHCLLSGAKRVIAPVTFAAYPRVQRPLHAFVGIDCVRATVVAVGIACSYESYARFAFYSLHVK